MKQTGQKRKEKKIEFIVDKIITRNKIDNRAFKTILWRERKVYDLKKKRY